MWTPAALSARRRRGCDHSQRTSRSRSGVRTPHESRAQPVVMTADAATRHVFAYIDFSIDFEWHVRVLEELEARILESPLDTRAALVGFQPSEDSYQQQLLAEADRTIRMVAPAGSGKTQTVINRVLSRVR